MLDPYAVDLDACHGRQRRLLDVLLPLEVDLTLLTRRESVQWLTGAHVRPPFEPIAALTADGQVTLVLPEHQVSESAAADEVLGCDVAWHSTMRDDQRAASSAVLHAKWRRTPRRVACEFEAFTPNLLLTWNAALVEIDSILFELRRRKDADELRMLARANEANRAMYEHARRIVRPGLNELELYSELHSVAVAQLGESPTYFGQDFRFCHLGGPPRNRKAEAGELLILDLGVGFRGYYSDNARTIVVDGNPTAEQQRAWKVVADVFPIIEVMARPGVSCRHLYESVHLHLNAHKPWSFNHHLGHGVGLAAHEGPHLNPRWDDTLAEGDFIAVEPGIYDESLRAGVRLEQNYFIDPTGAKLLTDWPLEMTAST
jgi:Xaa-Pro aminopeptidase